MGEYIDRRTRKKAQTREHIRVTAQRLFAARGFEAVTIADVAAEADVAVQTVFNHFATKEDLFFAHRAPWIESLGAAVRSRSPETPPLQALRRSLLALVETYMTRAGTPSHRRLMATLQASPALLAYERQLQHEAESRVREALIEAWTAPSAGADDDRPDDVPMSAALTAAIWGAAIRAVLMEQRTCPPEPGDTSAVRAVLQTAEALLDCLDDALPRARNVARDDGRRPADSSR